MSPRGALRKPHLNSFPAQDGEHNDDASHAAVGDGDNHNWENLQVVGLIQSLDDCVGGYVVELASCVARVGEKSFTALSRPEIDVHVPTSTLLEKVHLKD